MMNWDLHGRTMLSTDLTADMRSYAYGVERALECIDIQDASTILRGLQIQAAVVYNNDAKTECERLIADWCCCASAPSRSRRCG